MQQFSNHDAVELVAVMHCSASRSEQSLVVSKTCCGDGAALSKFGT